MSNETMLKIGEVAKRLAISVGKLTYMAERGEIVGYKIGRSWRFFPSDVQSYLATCKGAVVAGGEK